MGRKEKEDTKADIELLLECVEYQKGNTSAVKQALVTLSSAVSESAPNRAQDIFRNAGGIQKVLDIVTETKIDEIKEVGLFCLGNAVEKNVYSQKLVSNASFFNLLHGILSPTSSAAPKKRQMGAFVLLCLVSNNSFGQNMARQSSCLHDILSLIRTTLSSGRRDVELWATLLRAACVCVNNPVNEENQRICSTLFPYLLSVVGNHTDGKVLKPALSLMCLTISYNAQNQVKLARCGGLPILVRKLRSLLTEKGDVDKQEIAVQLICTLDVCITENENSSKALGELGGIMLVLNMLLAPGINSQDRIQLVLTLAHAVDAYDANKDLISQGNGIKILIQQMTETSNEELTKTTKYLLHMCVSSDTHDVIDGDDDRPNLDDFAVRLEEMKRKSDLEILQKLNDLDSKLNVIGHREPDTSRHMFDSVPSLGNPEIYLSDISDVQSHRSIGRPPSVCSSSTNTGCKHDCPTPREKSLIDELVKEKMEREKLQKLNHLLQEDVVTSRAALAEEKENRQQTKKVCNQSHKTDRNDLSYKHKPSISDLTRNTNVYPVTNQFGCDVDELQNNRNLNPSTKEDRSVKSMQWDYDSSYEKPMLPASVRNDIMNPSNIGCQNNVLYAYPVYDISSTVKNRDSMGINVNENRDTFSRDVNSTTNPIDLSINGSGRPIHGSLRNRYVEPVNGNKSQNLTRNVSNQTTIPFLSSDANVTVNASVTRHQEPFKERIIEPSKSLNRNNSSVTRSQAKENAEIQCGTPYVNNDNTKLDKNKTQMDESCQTYFPTRSNTVKRKLIDTSTGPSSVSDTNTTEVNDSASAKVKDSCDKVVKVSLQDVLSIRSSKSTTQKVQAEKRASEQVAIGQKDANQTKQSIDPFLKPIAAPPRKKVRVTPLLGTKKVFNTSTVRPQKQVEIQPAPSVCDVESEFDLTLVRAVKHQQQKPVNTSSRRVDPSMVYGINNRIKSQNNTRKIDRHLDDSRHDTTHTWNVCQGTPENRHVVPVRPAFSDCGTSRFSMFHSPSSVKSVGFLCKKNLNDNGMHTPQDIVKPGSPDSSLDSSIEGCRSDSDDSEDEIKSLNITAAALRSNKQPRSNPKLCPGCHSSKDDKGNFLTSRTYNIVLEKDPNTCSFHRRLRLYERNYIKSVKRRIRMGKRTSGRLLDFNFNSIPAERLKSGSFEYIPSDSDSEHVTPPGEDDNSVIMKYKSRQRVRRQRLPYTREEEENLREGVTKMGKYWNQILVTYDFHPSRTNVDLKDKYKRMMAASGEGSQMTSVKPSKCLRPFSLCEERRLRKGVRKMGHNWKAILNSYSFEKGRTSEELRNKWRVLQKQLGLD